MDSGFYTWSKKRERESSILLPVVLPIHTKDIISTTHINVLEENYMVFTEEAPPLP